MARLINAEALEEKIDCPGEPLVYWDDIKNAPTIEAIPVAVMERAILGIDFADQCDQAGRSDYELRRALKTVLSWYHAPVYKRVEEQTRL